MKVFVTGASGHLATNTIIQLLDQGYDVVAYLRNKHKFLLEESHSLKLVEGNYTPDDLMLAMKGCDVVVHTAAQASQGKVRYRTYEAANVEPTRKVCDAALREGVRRMIYISTANVFAYGSKEHPGDESKPSRFPFTHSQYVISKRIAQEQVLSLKDRMEVIVLNPSFMLGPYDQKPGSNMLVQMGMKNRVIFYPPGGKNFVHVKDVAAAIVNAIKNGMNGESYLLAHENLSYLKFFKMLGIILHKRFLLVRMPSLLMIIVGALGDFLKLLGIDNSLFRINVEIIRTNNYYSGKKAQDELGIRYRSVNSAIEDSYEWLNKNRTVTSRG